MLNEFKNLICGQIISIHYMIQCTKFRHNRIIVHWDMPIRHNDFHISSRPPSWTWDYVIILHPVIDFHSPNVVLNFHVDWSGSFRTSLTFARLATDRQTDRQTERRTDKQTYIVMVWSPLATSLGGDLIRRRIGYIIMTDVCTAC